jgi:hypothetical protein
MVMQTLAATHDILAVDIDRLHLIASSPDNALPENRMRAVVTRDLLDLCGALEQHFGVEEGVIASSALARGGGAGFSLAALRGEHRRILALLRQLASMARELPIDVLKLRISDALDLLGEHERAESSMAF